MLVCKNPQCVSEHIKVSFYDRPYSALNFKYTGGNIRVAIFIVTCDDCGHRFETSIGGINANFRRNSQ